MTRIEERFVRPVKVRRAPKVTDGHGSERRDWANAVDVAQPDVPAPYRVRGWLAQFSTEEQAEQRDATITRFHLRLHTGFDIEADDQVVVDEDDDEPFSVDGEPARPWGDAGEHHVHAVLRRARG